MAQTAPLAVAQTSSVRFTNYDLTLVSIHAPTRGATGIDNCKKEFIEENNLQDQYEDTGENFYSSLPFMSGLKVKLVNKMAALGMEHRMTVARRFDADDWRPWERIGIRAILDEFFEENN